ncbi:hypothetical protein [Natronorubrum daqingense]|nr:hypothetical protein [Natronorubrum daqingense]
MASFGRSSALLVGILLVTSLGAIGVTGAHADSDEPVPEEILEEIDATEDVEAVYVSDDGDAVLTYDYPHDASQTGTTLEGQFGLDTDPGVAYTHYTGAVDEDERGVSGDLSVHSDHEHVSSTGDVLIEDPAPITDLEAAINVEQTDAESTSSGDVRATVAEHDPDYDALETTGELEATSESITSSGTLSLVEAEIDGVPAGTDSLEATVVERDDGYSLEVSERRVIEDWETDRWETREDAGESLENRYSSIAVGLGGTADGEIESYDYVDGEQNADGDQNIVEYEYHVEYAGVTDEVAAAAVSLVQQQAETDLDETEAQAMADRLAEAHVEELHFTVDRDGEETDIEWDLEADAHDEVVLGTVELADSIESVDDDLADRFDDVRETLEVRAETDLKRTTSWDVTAERPDDLTTVDATWESDSENWERHASALEERELEALTPDRTATFDAESTEDGLDVVYDSEARENGILEWSPDGLGDVGTVLGVELCLGDVGVDTDDVVPMSSVDELVQTAELAKTDLTIDDGTYELEGAAADPDATIESVPIGGEDELTASELHVETTGGSSTVYVVADGFTGADPTEAEIRDREQVGSETTVSTSGEADADVPEIDYDRVETLLETELDRGEAFELNWHGVGAVIVVLGSLAAVTLGFYAARPSVRA